jgi:hypothetical protein
MSDQVNQSGITSILKSKIKEFQLLYTDSEKLEILEMIYNRYYSARYNDDAPRECFVHEESLSSILYSLNDFFKECLNCSQRDLYFSKLNVTNYLNSNNGYETIHLEFYCPICYLEYKFYDDWTKDK